MISVQRILPYTKQLVLYALYDVLDSEESDPNSRPLPS